MEPTGLYANIPGRGYVHGTAERELPTRACFEPTGARSEGVARSVRSKRAVRGMVFALPEAPCMKGC